MGKQLLLSTASVVNNKVTCGGASVQNVIKSAHSDGGQEKCPKIMSKQAKLRELRQWYDDEIIDKETYDRNIQKLLSGGDATAVGDVKHATGVAVGTNASATVHYGDQIFGNVYHGHPTDDPAEALRIYQAVLFHALNRQPLRGMAKRKHKDSALTLANIYIDLNTTATERNFINNREIDHKIISALKAVADNRKVVLTGDPGSGKSTFVRHLAFSLSAHALESEAGWLANWQKDWLENETDILPLILILRDFARWLPDPLPETATPNDLWRFIEEQLGKQKLEFVANPLQQRLQAGNAIILLDGLDEVPTIKQRIFVRDAVKAFVGRFEKNRFVVTSRILSYLPPVEDDGEAEDLRLDPHEFPIYELAPFTQEQIDQFVEAWYREMANLGELEDATKVEELIEELGTATRRHGLRRLAPNPLLLNVMAYVHHHDGKLPHARVLLYERAVIYLLYRWDEQKRQGGADVSPLTSLLAEANRSEVDLQRALWQLAYETHGQVAGREDDEAVADIGEAALRRALANLKKDRETGQLDWNWADQALETIKARSGLLIERDNGVFAFPHRTFQEYMAGAYLASLPDFAEVGKGLVAERTVWREVILLAVGILVHSPQGGTEKPLALMAELCPATGIDSEAGWQAVWMAGDVALEIGVERLGDSELGKLSLWRARLSLAQLVAGGHLTPRERLQAGDVLGELGDPRPGVGVMTVANGLRLPDIVWGRVVPVGRYKIGGKYGLKVQEISIEYPFQLAKYPITVAQFACFVGAEDINKAEWWKGMPEEAKYKANIGNSYWQNPNRPRESVTWYQAVAFCRWLSHHLQMAGKLSKEEAILLPHEIEWEVSARYAGDGRTDDRIYPWKEGDISPDHASYDENLGQTSPVGMFPMGKQADLDLYDLSGNVWEWCRNKLDKSHDEREDEGGARRVVRGGSWFFSQSFARSAYRLSDVPNSRFNLLGFRLDRRPPSHT